jgi:A118 family predicted phage portal protein
MDKIVKDFLSKHGYRDCIDENQETRVNEWLDIFKGPTKKYNIKIYNGKNYTKYTIKSLNLPSQICGDLADFFFNEKLDITIDKEKVQKKIKDCLEQNKFLHNGNKLMQLVKALGTGALVPYLDNGVLRINYVNATNIIILKANADEVIDVLFWSKTKTKDGYEYYFNLHVLEDNGYVIYNEKKIESGKDVKDIDLGDVAEIKTKSYLPKFGMIFTPEINNFDIDSPYGISCYANAIDTIFSTDRAYDSLDNEMALGRKRVYVGAGAMNFNVNENGEPVPVFDANDIAYYALPGEDNKELLKESSFDLRIAEISEAIQYNLNLTTSKVGLGHNYYKFKDGEVYVNADNVLSSNSDVYRKIKKQQNIITNAITNLIYAIAELIGIKNKFSISVFYDDTIIEDTEKTQKQAQSEYNSKLISKAQYYRDVYKLKDAEALAFAKQMNEEIIDETITDGLEPVGDE